MLEILLEDSRSKLAIFCGADFICWGNKIYNRQQLQEVKLCGGLLEIGEGAFNSCNSLRHIKIPSTLTVIRPRAFNNCWKLETIQLNEGLLEIGDWTFNCCILLKDITIPPTVRAIGEYALYNTKLSHINLPDGIESIGGRAFCYSKLLNFRMPPLNITTIPEGLFYTCGSLFSLELSESTAQLGEEASAPAKATKRQYWAG